MTIDKIDWTLGLKLTWPLMLGGLAGVLTAHGFKGFGWIACAAAYWEQRRLFRGRI